MSKAGLVSLVLFVAAGVGLGVAANWIREIDRALAELETSVAKLEAAHPAKTEGAESASERELARLRGEIASLKSIMDSIASQPTGTGPGVTRADVKTAIQSFLEEEKVEARRREATKSAERMTLDSNKYLARLTRELDLDAAQQAQVKDLLEDQVKAYEKIHCLPPADPVVDPATGMKTSPSLLEKERVDREVDERIRAVLKAEQLPKFNATNRKWSDQMSRTG